VKSVINNFDFGKMLTEFVAKKLIADQHRFLLNRFDLVNRNTYYTSTGDNATTYNCIGNHQTKNASYNKTKEKSTKNVSNKESIIEIHLNMQWTLF